MSTQIETSVSSFSVMIQAKGWKPLWALPIICFEFCDALTSLSIVYSFSFPLTIWIPDFLYAFLSSELTVCWFASPKHKGILLFIYKWFIFFIKNFDKLER